MDAMYDNIDVHFFFIGAFMKKYKQLTSEQRYTIYQLIKINTSIRSIARIIGVHASTISREIRRNKGMKGYRNKQAHNKAIKRKQKVVRLKKIDASLKETIDNKLIMKWSPEQIAGHLEKKEGKKVISFQALYNYIHKDKRNNGSLYLNLRHGCIKKRRNGGYLQKKEIIKNKVSIEQRPTIVDQKLRIGDWEVDTVIGKNHKGALVTIVERKTAFVLIMLVNKKTARSVSDAIIKKLSPYQKTACFTLTSDNGLEFANHEDIKQALNIDYFFAHPYKSCERGLNEYTNKLIRQYLPKGTSFDTITHEYCQFIEYQLNNRPRKKLAYRTPSQEFYSHFNDLIKLI